MSDAQLLLLMDILIILMPCGVAWASGVKCITLQNVGKCTLDPWLTNRLCSKTISVCFMPPPPHSNYIGEWASVHCSCILGAFTILINLYAVCMVDGCLWVAHLCVERTNVMCIFIRVLQIIHSSTYPVMYSTNHWPGCSAFLMSFIHLSMYPWTHWFIWTVILWD